eukprot:gnl/MRDRNA2_/MRDRNA2_15789_c0_seq1.p1 gnl/MRDRNA2_/MRDRNA2_15789_c0~~gnl/MRDRNA2_/MRDRNA2_15789_c0_seq1.p1  ORF type:complete len:132 (-),score=20.51 gnl/MRDRNA2_/MRDRNA2_15789_c0_seq1:301-696(-)
MANPADACDSQDEDKVLVEDDLRVQVEGAGTTSFNGIYTFKEGDPTFYKEGSGGGGMGTQIKWYGPAAGKEIRSGGGWYFEHYGLNVRASYFIESNDHAYLPLNGWSVYKGQKSDPGEEPSPTILDLSLFN